MENTLNQSGKSIENYEHSKLQEFYNGSTIFITGGSGYIGSLVIEKLLRSCVDIKIIYILIREKKAKSIEKRFEELLEMPMFERLKKEQPNFAEKCVLMNGDCALPELGLNNEDRQKFITEVNCVFHCAATVRFNEVIRIATNINVRATRDILRLCKETINLKSFVYVSTAYSHCIKEYINEEFYESSVSGESLIQMVEMLNDNILQDITPSLTGKWPNTYVYTKAVAEDIVKCEGKDLPIAIIRPSIVISTVHEPIAGWNYNVHGVIAVLIGLSLGLIRCVYCKCNNLSDMVPADFVVNCTLAAGWDVGTRKSSLVQNGAIFDKIEDTEDEKNNICNIPIYNYVSSCEKPITWQKYADLAEKSCKQVPSSLIVWHYYFFFVQTMFTYKVAEICFHLIPAYCIDLIAFCVGKEPLSVKFYKKIGRLLNALYFFTSHKWNFNNDNTQALWKKLNLEDQKLYNFNMKTFDWESYFHTYARGARVYILKDPMDTLPQGRRKYLKFQLAHYMTVTVVGLLLLKCLHVLYNSLF